MLGEMTLIEHAIAGLTPQVDAVLVCGRSIDGVTSVADRPAPDLGPLGGLNAALAYAAGCGFEAVVSVPCDVPMLPADLVARLRDAGRASFVAGMPVVGLWPASLAGLLDALLIEDGDRSMRGWAARVGALPVAVEGLVNVNTPADLRGLA
jgi:molybdopterin-guanine dinucleotide biosynthesis protein A